ncbi:MAG TPA: preprotein translocase subunit SecG [Planctomycetaceae bacterium]|nr:preprotein translocase subunit SecG [Planctomycetaceae bacterium]
MLFAALGHYFFGITIFILSFFLILLVLVQRGRGGGIAGALGGPGGQSAFGTKAGDLFTRITIGVAALWIVVCGAAVYFLQDSSLTGIGTDIIVDGSGDAPTLGAPENDDAGSAAPEIESGDFGGDLGDSPTGSPENDPAAGSNESADDDTDSDESDTGPAEQPGAPETPQPNGDQ